MPRFLFEDAPDLRLVQPDELCDLCIRQTLFFHVDDPTVARGEVEVELAVPAFPVALCLESAEALG